MLNDLAEKLLKLHKIKVERCVKSIDSTSQKVPETSEAFFFLIKIGNPRQEISTVKKKKALNFSVYFNLYVQYCEILCAEEAQSCGLGSMDSSAQSIQAYNETSHLFCALRQFQFKKKLHILLTLSLYCSYCQI